MIAALITTVATLVSAFGAVTGTAALPAPLGACTGGPCPNPYPEGGNGPFVGRDASIYVFAGGSFSVTSTSAESEGRMVIMV